MRAPAALSARAVALAGAGLAALVASRGFGTPALAVLGAGLVALPLLAGALVAAAASGLRVRRAIATANPRAGDPLLAQVRLEGWPMRTGLARLLVCALDPGLAPVGGGRPAREEGAGRWRVLRAVRGEHHLPPPAVTVSDPFGVARRRRAPGASERLVVPPEAPVIGGLPHLRPGSGQGTRRRRSADGWGELDRVREYRAGDSLSRVHWGQTAKRGRLQTKELRGHDGERPTTLVLLDAADGAGASDAGGSGPFELAVSVAAALVRHLDARGRAVAFAHTGRRPESVAAGAGAWRAAEAALARVRADGPRPASAALRAAAGGRGGPEAVVLVTTAPDPRLAEVAARLPASTGVLVVVTGDAAEAVAALTAAGLAAVGIEGRDDIAAVLTGGRARARRP